MQANFGGNLIFKSPLSLESMIIRNLLKELFDIVHEKLRKRNAASGGEEMLRLRAYEKLQNLVSRGMVKKTGKKYRGLASLANALETTDAPAR